MVSDYQMSYMDLTNKDIEIMTKVVQNLIMKGIIKVRDKQYHEAKVKQPVSCNSAKSYC